MGSPAAVQGRKKVSGAHHRRARADGSGCSPRYQQKPGRAARENHRVSRACAFCQRRTATTAQIRFDQAERPSALKKSV
jgi:hypothetical protein